MVLVRDGDKEKMLADREHLRKQLVVVTKAAGYEIDSYLEDYAVDVFRLKYKNAFNAQDGIKVEINYVAGRIPIDPLEMHKPHDLFDLELEPVQTLSVHEVYASKVEALIKRRAPRDFFDVYLLATSNLVQIPELRSRTIFSCCVEIPYDFRDALKVNPADQITQEQVTNELQPYLRNDTEFNLTEAKASVGGFSQELLKLEQTQDEFLDRFFDRGEYVPDLLFPGKNHLKDHPGMKWRLQQLGKGRPR